MNKTEQAIFDTLSELETAAKDMATAKIKRDLLPLFARLDELCAQIPPDGDGELRHFLQRRSYDKARLRLKGLTISRGTCGK
jgi:hypothetical protein